MFVGSQQSAALTQKSLTGLQEHVPKKKSQEYCAQQSAADRQGWSTATQLQVLPEQVNPPALHVAPQPPPPVVQVPPEHVPGGEEAVQSAQMPPPLPHAVLLTDVWHVPVVGSVHVVQPPVVHPEPGWQTPPHPSLLLHGTPAHCGEHVVHVPLTQLPDPQFAHTPPPVPHAWVVLPDWQTPLRVQPVHPELVPQRPVDVLHT